MKKSGNKALIPATLPGYKDKLTQPQQSCIIWHVLTGCEQADAFITFLHPEMASARGVASKLASEFFSAKDVMKFEDKYRELINGTMNPQEGAKQPRQESFMEIERREGEDASDFKERRKRMAVEQVVNKIIDQIDTIEDLDGLLDTIKAMEKTGFLDADANAELPPQRYLPETCSGCEYKKFIDEQVKSNNIQKI